MKRSKFSLSHYKLLSMNMGNLVPIGLTEVLPGDSIQQATSALLRASPLMAPVMHPVHVRIHHWYVPHRIVWDDFEDFITGGPDGYDDSAFPTVTLTFSAGSPPTGTNLVGGLPDYLGVPPAINNLTVSALPFRAYALIYNEWYRDQDLVSPLPISTESGPDTDTSLDLVNVAWERDYFTSSRPWEQKGPSISIPLSGDAPLSPSTAPIDVPGGTLNFNSGAGSGASFSNQPLRALQGGSGNYGAVFGTSTGAINREAFLSSNLSADLSGVSADLSGVSAITVNQLREAMALQRYEEARARYGSRYVEYLRYLGVRSSDARLQRPEYLGGGKQTIQFSEVLQLAPGDDQPVGQLRGHGIAAVRSNRYRRFIEEHGYIISMISVRPKTIYTQALPRTWNRRIKEDFWQRELQHIGQQEVLNKELKANHADPEGLFGFQDRYDEYRRSESMVAGEFRTSELDFWHFARTFAGNPALNGDFVTSTPTTRPFAIPSEDTLYVMANHSIQARRMVAKTGKSYIF